MLELIESFILLLMIMDPLLSLTAFLSLAKGKPKREQRRIAIKAIIVAAFVFFLFAFGGGVVLLLLGVDINTFKAAGGVILILLGVQMALGLSFPKDKSGMGEISEIAVVIGTPLISGPAAITTTIILVKTIGLATTLVSGTLALLVVFLFLLLAMQINRLLGNSGIRVLSTMMGLVTIAWGMQYLLTGVTGFL